MAELISSHVVSVVSQSRPQLHFTITAKILARLLANIYCQKADRHEFKIYTMRQRARADNLTIRIVKNKLMSVSFNVSVCPVIDNEFRHNVVKVVCGSTRLSLATLTVL